MSDSVDRVFVHALNTVKKIPRTGSARPPSAERLKLYGLYKQSMEGDVAGVMARPEEEGERGTGEGEKWDAWSAQHGLSRTEAKRRYISTLIATMHTYASSTPEARELVAELEFVWDQIRANEASSGSEHSLHPPEGDLPPLLPHSRSRERRPGAPRDEAQDTAAQGMRLLRPFSEGDEEESLSSSDEDGPDAEGAFQPIRAPPAPLYDASGALLPTHTASYEVRNRKWRKRMERAVVQMTAEVAALRELVEQRRGIWGRGRVRRGWWAWVRWLLWVVVRHALFDAVVVGVWVVWLRRRGKREKEVGREVGEWVRGGWEGGRVGRRRKIRE
ncbi:hypothetical protein MMC13_008175 [Lambiella insularis]|nr:hypothetical protein [Lambiella insularis]